MAVASDALGIPGYFFADLHDPERLSSLYERFCEDVQASDSGLWREWDEYRRAPDAARPPIALSNLLIAMAPHVSRFLTRLFDVSAPASATADATRAQDDLFRFKVDFVRRRALPLLKGGARVVSTGEEDTFVERRLADAGAAASKGDREPAGARAGCGLLDAERGPAPPPVPAAASDALKRWCAARIHDP